MNRKELREIRSIAWTAREWTEKRMRESVYFLPDLMGMCAIASGKLHKLLTKAGYPAVIHIAHEKSESDAGASHVFVKIKNTVIDITATQFGCYDKVIVTGKPDDMWFWKTRVKLDSVKSLRNFQKREQWHHVQIALP